MKNNKPHLKLDTSVQKDPKVGIKFHYGFPDFDEEHEEPQVNYTPMVDSFRRSLTRLGADRINRRSAKNRALGQLPEVEHIQVQFQDQFRLDEFHASWYTNFGLLGVEFKNFNREGLFTVVDPEKFTQFLHDIYTFIQVKTNPGSEETYDKKILFVKEFRLLTTNDIILSSSDAGLINIKLINPPLPITDLEKIQASLKVYLSKKGISHRLNEETNTWELHNPSQDSVLEIAQNFDAIASVTSSLSTVVSPSLLNTVTKGYGFSINNASPNLPPVGILDTGVSNQTPLSSILIDDESFNLTNSSVFIDGITGGDGHGTAVAALAALGRKPYENSYQGQFSPDARILSMKILDGDRGYLSDYDVYHLLVGAKTKYPNLKVFVLATCYDDFKKYNEAYSNYALLLDRFAHEYDCLIFICTANNQSIPTTTKYDPAYFKNESTNISVPAESMNNITVGASADNLKVSTPFKGIALSRDFPAFYTRTSHIDLTKIFSKNKQNHNLFKPDIIESGGDYEQDGQNFLTGDDASLDLLSADPQFSFFKTLGTSFSTPLAANTALKIQTQYPSLRSQTIKALLINGATQELVKFPKDVDLKKTIGFGAVRPNESNWSNPDSITFIIEDEISPTEMKIIPLKFPDYLTTEDLGKERGLLNVKATLCFSFAPVQDNHLSYCPIQIAFSFFRNQSGEEIIEKEKIKKSKLKSTLSWSQNNRWRSKPIPSSNAQKIEFPVNLKELVDENSVFKLAIHCLLSTQLLAPDKYNMSHKFSLAITITETLPASRSTGRLYNEMVLINEVENIAMLDNDIDIEVSN